MNNDDWKRSIHENGMFGDVRVFHYKFKQLVGDRPQHLTKRKLAERANFMLEELREFVEAAGLRTRVVDNGDAWGIEFFPQESEDQDLAGQADALIDLVYVALGTAVMLGLPWQALWDDVHAANLRKELRPTPHRAGFQHPAAMIGKPSGWVGPQTAKILEMAGYDRLSWTDGGVGGVVRDEFCLDDDRPAPDRLPAGEVSVTAYDSEDEL